MYVIRALVNVLLILRLVAFMVFCGFSFLFPAYIESGRTWEMWEMPKCHGMKRPSWLTIERSELCCQLLLPYACFGARRLRFVKKQELVPKSLGQSWSGPLSDNYPVGRLSISVVTWVRSHKLRTYNIADSSARNIWVPAISPPVAAMTTSFS